MDKAKTIADIRKLDSGQLTEAVEKLGEKPFRAKQLRKWLWQKASHSFDEMTDLSKGFREKLREQYAIYPVEVADAQASSDGTVKFRFLLNDGNEAEGVLIPAADRMTACISSQVGCALHCHFCATGYLDRKRNIDAAEIYDQVVLIDREAKRRYGTGLTNIVYMGMGEPLLNYAEVMKSVDLITSEQGLGMSPRRLTLSTVGITKMIRKLADDGFRCNLAVSLHAAEDEKRSAIMNINPGNPLDTLMDSLRYFYDQTGTRITYEYIVFNNFNDTLKDAENLYNLALKVPCKINIIEYNPIDEADFRNTTEEKLEMFREYLESRGIVVNVRRSRGKDIDAACGQLAGKNKKEASA